MNTKIKSIRKTRRPNVGILSTLIAMLAMAIGTSNVNAGATVTATKDTPVTLRIELDRSVLPANTTEKAIVKIALDGVRRERAESRPPVNLAVVLDRSSSMSGDKIIQAKAAAIEALNHLAADDIFSLVTFDTGVETVIPATRVGNGEALEARIRQIQPRGMTALYGGVSQGASELRKYMEDSRYIHRIILLSDGQANQGPRTAEELGRLGTALVKEGISVTTVGLGLGYDEDLMTRLALRSDGNTYFVEGAPDLPRIFSAELGDVLNVVARGVILKIEFPSDVRPIRCIGRDGSIKGQTAEIKLNQIYGGQEKYALIEVEIPAREDNAEYTIVNATVVFNDPVTQKTATLEAKQNARFSADKEVVVKSANHQVQADYAQNLVAVTQEEAITLIDAGKKDEAASLMKSNARYLQQFGDSYSNAEVLSLSSEFEKQAETVQEIGYGATPTEQSQTRKAMLSSSASTVNQQSTSAVASEKPSKE